MLQLMKDELNALEAYSSTIDKKRYYKNMWLLEARYIRENAAALSKDSDKMISFLAEIQERTANGDQLLEAKVSLAFTVEEWNSALVRISKLKKLIKEEEERIKEEYKKNDQQSRVDLLLKILRDYVPH